MNDPYLIHQTLCASRRRPQVWLASLLALFIAGLAAHAAVILDLPEITLQPNQANQSFTISVQNTGDSIQFNGVQLELVVGNGFGQGPAFQAVTLLAAGSLFALNNTGDRGVGELGNSGQIFQRLTSTASGTVTLAPGTFDLATVTFDTTGLIDMGSFSWSAAASPNGISFFTGGSGQVFPTLIDGTLTVVPEPVHVALPIFGGIAVLMAGVRRWSRRKASAD